ncbi:MAG: leucine-rich repeat domain-containing protein, partial [Opitutae bacterium]|nr:leucine-rich repeat domain-containing protein [Opitutae bacterium]
MPSWPAARAKSCATATANGAASCWTAPRPKSRPDAFCCRMSPLQAGSGWVLGGISGLFFPRISVTLFPRENALVEGTAAMKNKSGPGVVHMPSGKAWGWAVLFGWAAATAVQAQDFLWETNADSTIVITGYAGPGGNVEIPGILEGKTVTSIGDWALIDCESLTGITFPASITNIGNWAFNDCENLIGVTIPDRVVVIGYEAFSSCGSLAAIEVAAGNLYYSSTDGVLFDYDKATLIQCPGGKAGSYAIPGSVIHIGDAAFESCRHLTNVVISGSVTHIGRYAFWGCVNLMDIVIPGSIDEIGFMAFYDCNGLTNLWIPSGVLHIEDCAFFSCENLMAVDVDGANAFYSSLDGVLFDLGKTKLIQCPGAKTGSYAVPADVEEISSWAFAYCGSLTNIAIPSGVTTIGHSAFANCESLLAIEVDPANTSYSSVEGVLFDHGKTTLIQFPEGRAGSYAIPGGVAVIGEGAFYGCIGLTNVILSGSVTHLMKDAFSHCSGLTSIDIPDSATHIGEYAFYDCSSLVRVTIGRGVDDIGPDAFLSCRDLAEAYFAGDAPDLEDPDVFSDSDDLIVYCLPGATGWGSEFGGRPTALWLPEVKGDEDFGVQAGGFGFTIGWAAGKTVVVEA